MSSTTTTTTINSKKRVLPSSFRLWPEEEETVKRHQIIQNDLHTLRQQEMKTAARDEVEFRKREIRNGIRKPKKRPVDFQRIAKLALQPCNVERFSTMVPNLRRMALCENVPIAILKPYNWVIFQLKNTNLKDASYMLNDEKLGTKTFYVQMPVNRLSPGTRFAAEQIKFNRCNPTLLFGPTHNFGKGESTNQLRYVVNQPYEIRKETPIEVRQLLYHRSYSIGVLICNFR